MNKNFTIICVSYRSNEKVKKLIQNLGGKFNIVIVENSNNRHLAKKFEKNRNIKFLFPKNNNGFGAGLNFGLKKIKTKYILYLDLDTKISPSQIFRIYKKSIKISNFGVITTYIQGQDYKKLILGTDKSNNMKYVSFNTGCVMMFEKKIFNLVGYFDERFFLYFEETDFYERCKKINKKIYLLDKIKVIHHGSGSIDKTFNENYKRLRNWHYCWSKYNFYLKHKGIFVALSKTFPNLRKSILGMIINFIFYNDKKMSLSYAEFSGLINAYFGLDSNFRIHLSQ